MESMRDLQALLTQAEMEVVALLSKGYCPKEIAQKRKRSPHTIYDQIYVVKQKLGLHSQPEVIKLYSSLKTDVLFSLDDAEAVYEEAGHQIWQSMLKDDGRPDYWNGTPHPIDCGCIYCT